MYVGTLTELNRSLQLLGPRVQRYLVAEVVAMLVALGTISVANDLTANSFLLVVASVYGSTVSYYSVLLVYTFRAERCTPHTKQAFSAIDSLLSTGRTLITDLGSAELLDSLLFSPGLLYLGLHLLPNHQLAVLVSEIGSTAAFYMTVYLIQQIQRRRKQLI